MKFYEVLVSSSTYHGQEPLTYQSSEELSVGSIVVVPLRKKPVVGVVLKEVSKPSFKTLAVEKLVLPLAIPAETMALADWLRSYYPAPLGMLTQLLLPSSLLRKRDISPVAAGVAAQMMMVGVISQRQIAVRAEGLPAAGLTDYQSGCTASVQHNQALFLLFKAIA